MAISQPVSTDVLSSPDHSLMHRQIATDPSAPVQTIVAVPAGAVIKGAGTTTGEALKVTNVTPATVFSMRDDGILTLPLQSGCRVILNNASQAIPATTWTKILFDLETYDTQGEFVPYTNTVATQARFTAKVAGTYLISPNIIWYDGTSGKIYQVAIYKNGSAINPFNLQICGITGNNVIMSAWTDILVLAAGDYIEVFAYTDFNEQRIQYYSSVCIAKIR